MSWYFKDKVLLPQDFDFTGSVLLGRLSEYEFDRVLSSGSQGYMLKYRDRTTGSPVVFKAYRRKESSNPKMEHRHTDAHLDSLLEHDFLGILSVVARVAAYIDTHHTPKGYPTPKKIRKKFFKKATQYNDHEMICKHPISIAPLYVDEADRIKDTKTGKIFYPFCLPSNGIIDEMTLRSIIDSHGFSAIYTFEEGQTLEQIISSGSFADERHELTKKVVAAVMTAHAFGIMHNDLKPENIIVTPDKRIKLLDFGLARKFYPSDRIAAAARVPDIRLDYNVYYEYVRAPGSRLFNPPEAANRYVSNKTDIFSVGLIGALLLTGRHPYLEPPYSDYQHFLQLQGAEQDRIKNQYDGYISKYPYTDEEKEYERKKHEHFMSLQLRTDERERIIKEYEEYTSAFAESDECRAELLKRYADFLSLHDDDLLAKFAPMFHPDAQSRPNRMLVAGRMLGLDLPQFPAIYHYCEVGDVDKSAPGFKNKLKMRDMWEAVENFFWPIIRVKANKIFYGIK
jgi:serine/threonine protein kinase